MQTAEAINKYIEQAGGDGHTIFKDEYIRGMGFSNEFVDKFASDHSSGNTGKSTIFDDRGNVMETCMGVYALDFLYGIAKDVGADMTIAHSKMGRGFQAQALVIAIKDAIK